MSLENEISKGNDHAEALAELATKFGKGVGNAEELINAVRDGYAPELRAALRYDENHAATETLDAEVVAEKAGVPEARLTDYAVRGPYVVICGESESGRPFKDVLPFPLERDELAPVAAAAKVPAREKAASRRAAKAKAEKPE